ncbi:hypothetical protein SALBM311S_11073 [Streptomyces alboniger]
MRDTARGVHRFDELQRELGLSLGKVLTERLHLLVEADALARVLYQAAPGAARVPAHPARPGHPAGPDRPPGLGRRLGPGRWSTTATAAEASAEARRVHELLGTRVPELRLLDHTGATRDPVTADTPYTVLYCFPGAYARADAYPPGWSEIPGAPGCTLESRTYRDRAEFTAAGATVHGVSTQRPDEQREFADLERIDFPLLSDAGLALSPRCACRRSAAAGASRLKRLTLVVDRERIVRDVQYPVTDIDLGAALALVRDVADRRAVVLHAQGDLVAARRVDVVHLGVAVPKTTPVRVLVVVQDDFLVHRSSFTISARPSAEEVPYVLQPVDQSVDLGRRGVQIERRSRGRRNSVPQADGACAVMTHAYRDALLVQNLAHVVRVDVAQREGDRRARGPRPWSGR